VVVEEVLGLVGLVEALVLVEEKVGLALSVDHMALQVEGHWQVDHIMIHQVEVVMEVEEVDQEETQVEEQDPGVEEPPPQVDHMEHLLVHSQEGGVRVDQEDHQKVELGFQEAEELLQPVDHTEHHLATFWDLMLVEVAEVLVDIKEEVVEEDLVGRHDLIHPMTGSR